MRKNRNIIGLICSIVLVFTMLTGCSEQSASTGSNANAGANDTQAAQATPSSAEGTSSEAQQPASQESTVEETASSAEVVADNPYIIDGIDFTDYYAGNKPIKHFFLNELNYDSLRWVVMYKDEIDSSIIGIYKDGDSVNWDAERITFWYLYSLKKVVSYEKLSEFKKYSTEIADGEKGYWVDVIFENDLTYNNDEVTFRFTYEDGTTEDITVYVTSE